MRSPLDAPARRTTTAVAAAAALAAVLAVLLWTTRDAGVELAARQPDPVPLEAVAPPAAPAPGGPSADASTLNEQSADAPVSSDLRSADADADAEQIAAVKAAFAESLRAGYHTRFAAGLTERGLAPADAERVVGTALDHVVSCTVDTLVAAAAEQDVELPMLLDAMEATLAHADGPDVVAIIDMQSVAPRLQACQLAAFQQAGIPLP